MSRGVRVILSVMAIVGLSVCGGCDQQPEFTPPPLPPIQPSQPEPQPEPEPTPEPPAPEPAMPEAPPSKPPVELPNVTWFKREFVSSQVARRQGLVFTAIVRVIGGDNGLPMRVAITDNQNHVLHFPAKRDGALIGIEEFVPGATSSGAPYYAQVEFQDPDTQEWKVFLASTPFQ